MKKLFLYWLPLIAHASLIYYLSSRQNFPVEAPPWAFFADKVVHAGLFGFLTLLAIRAWKMDYPGKVSIKVLIIITICVSLYGITDEVHQIYVPNREPDVNDWVADTIGAMIVSASYWFVQKKFIKKEVSPWFCIIQQSH